MNRKGIILVEAIVATVILAVSLTVIMQSLLGSYRSFTLQKDYSQALIMVENHLSKYLFDAEDLTDADFSKGHPKFLYTSSLSAKDSLNLKKVRLSIAWPLGHGQRELAVSSLVYVP